MVLFGPAVRAEAPVWSGEVTWVDDGDTLVVAGIGKVRLIGIDVPEREPSDRDRFFKQWQIEPAALRRVYGLAKEFVIRHARGKTVRLTLDQESRDRYGRLLAYVYLPDGRLLNRMLLDHGLAVVYRRFDFALKDEFLAAETAARRQGNGLWRK